MTGEREPVGRALDVLVWLATHPTPPWSVRHVARGLDTSPTTIHRIFGVFEGRGLLDKDGDGGYVPGLELYRICHSVAGQMSPVPLIRHYLEALTEECGETSLLGAYSPRRGELMYLDMVESPQRVRYIIELNEWQPAHGGASSLAIFAALPDDERNLIFSHSRPTATDSAQITREELESAVQNLQQNGFLWTRGQHTAGAVGIAAPVFDAVGDVFGDICVTIPEQRFDEGSLDSVGNAVVRTSKSVSEELQRLGYRRGMVERSR